MPETDRVEAASDRHVDDVRDFLERRQGWCWIDRAAASLIARIEQEVERAEQAEEALRECQGDPLAGDPSKWPHEDQIAGLGGQLKTEREAREQAEAEVERLREALGSLGADAARLAHDENYGGPVGRYAEEVATKTRQALAAAKGGDD